MKTVGDDAFYIYYNTIISKMQKKIAQDPKIIRSSEKHMPG